MSMGCLRRLWDRPPHIPFPVGARPDGDVRSSDSFVSAESGRDKLILLIMNGGDAAILQRRRLRFFLTRIALGATYLRAGDVGEVPSTIDRIRGGLARSRVERWTATAERPAAEARANASAERAHPAACERILGRLDQYVSA
jgi:hypothetical protein